MKSSIRTYRGLPTVQYFADSHQVISILSIVYLVNDSHTSSIDTVRTSQKIEKFIGKGTWF